MSADQFEVHVGEALDQVPDDLFALIDNCAVLVEDDPPPRQPSLLGLYVGVPLTERGSQYAGVLPDRIYIFRNPILQMCSTAEEVVKEVHITVVHEIAHYFGIGDDRLDELGYG